MPSADFCPATPCITTWSAPTNSERKDGHTQGAQIGLSNIVIFCTNTRTKVANIASPFSLALASSIHPNQVWEIEMIEVHPEYIVDEKLK